MNTVKETIECVKLLQCVVNEESYNTVISTAFDITVHISAGKYLGFLLERVPIQRGSLLKFGLCKIIG